MSQVAETPFHPLPERYREALRRYHEGPHPLPIDEWILARDARDYIAYAAPAIVDGRADTAR